MNIVDHPDIETVGLQIRTLNGVKCLFTTDGKLLANQCNEGLCTGHFWYAKDPNRLNVQSETFRATFLIDHDAVCLGGPVSAGGDK